MSRKACALLLAVVCAASTASRAERVGDGDRREAQCIDRYNAGDPELRSETDRLDENPILTRLLFEGSAAAPGGFSLGPRLDVDAVPLPLPFPGAAITGFATGISLQAQFDSAWEAVAFGGEGRLGIARRVYGMAWSTGSGRCKARRIDLRVDLLRWTVGGAARDRSAPDRRFDFVSSVGFPTVSLAYSYVNWGWKIETTVLDFQLAPQFDWGMFASHVEWSYGVFVVSARLLPRFAPHPEFTATLGFGVGNR